MKSATEDQLAIITKISNPPLPITTLSSPRGEIVVESGGNIDSYDVEAPQSETCHIIEQIDTPQLVESIVSQPSPAAEHYDPFFRAYFKR